MLVWIGLRNHAFFFLSRWISLVEGVIASDPRLLGPRAEPCAMVAVARCLWPSDLSVLLVSSTAFSLSKDITSGFVRSI